MFLAGNKMEETKNKTARGITRKKKILSKTIKRRRLLSFYDQVQAQGQIRVIIVMYCEPCFGH